MQTPHQGRHPLCCSPQGAGCRPARQVYHRARHAVLCCAMLCRHPIKADAPCVAALKQLGAVLLGKAAMVEFGCLATGYNTHLGSTRNPHNRNKASGGSSSGSAAAVAAGLCPIAIGTDGGGSIRIPSSLCGVMGLKPTMGRLADDHGGCSCQRAQHLAE